MRLRRTVIAPYSAAAMFNLVDGIESYPDFLPWCAAAEVSRDGEKVSATLHIRYLKMQTSFSTANIHRPPSEVDMTLAAGPLKKLTGGWRFTDIGDGRSRVEFELDYEFMAGPAGALFARVFQPVFGRFVDSFIARAKQHYGDGGRDVICVSVADEAGEQNLHLPRGATVGDALTAAGREGAKTVGVFGRECGIQTPLANGDRVEIYRPLAQDPRTARRIRADKP